MRCLVLGGCGFLGSHLVEALIDAGHFVRCFDRVGACNPSFRVSEGGSLELTYGDFLSEYDLTRALEEIDVCYHLVSTTIASTSNQNPRFDLETNVIGTLGLLDIGVRSGLKKLIFASSGGTVYGVPKFCPITEEHPTDPISSYGIAKLTIEKYLKLYTELHGLDSVILRLANPYGERQRTRAKQGAIAVFLGHALQEEDIHIWGDGSIVRDYLHVSDVADAMVKALSEPAGGGRILNIGSGTGYNINEILDAIERVIGKPTRRIYLPGRPFDVPVNVLDISAAKNVLGWTPKISLIDGVRRFAKWVNEGQIG